MSTHPGTVTLWQSGRLAPRSQSRRFVFTREQGLAAALLAPVALVLALYVAVLEKDVDRHEMAHMAQRSRAVAEAPPEAAPDHAVHRQDTAARATTVSLVGER